MVMGLIGLGVPEYASDLEAGRVYLSTTLIAILFIGYNKSIAQPVLNMRKSKYSRSQGPDPARTLKMEIVWNLL